MQEAKTLMFGQFKNEYPVGITIHEMNQEIDNGKYFVRKKLKLNFPYTGGMCLSLAFKILCRRIY